MLKQNPQTMNMVLWSRSHPNRNSTDVKGKMNDHPTISLGVRAVIVVAFGVCLFKWYPDGVLGLVLGMLFLGLVFYCLSDLFDATG